MFPETNRETSRMRRGGKGVIILMVSAMPLLIAVGIAWPALYRCEDRSGATVFTDSQAQLKNCTPIHIELPPAERDHSSSKSDGKPEEPAPTSPPEGPSGSISPPPLAQSSAPFSLPAERPSVPAPSPSPPLGAAPSPSGVAPSHFGAGPAGPPCASTVNPLNPFASPCLPTTPQPQPSPEAGQGGQPAGVFAPPNNGGMGP